MFTHVTLSTSTSTSLLLFSLLVSSSLSPPPSSSSALRYSPLLFSATHHFPPLLASTPECSSPRRSSCLHHTTKPILFLPIVLASPPPCSTCRPLLRDLLFSLCLTQFLPPLLFSQRPYLLSLSPDPLGSPCRSAGRLSGGFRPVDSIGLLPRAMLCLPCHCCH